MEVERSAQFPKQEEINEAINNFVERLFEHPFFENNKEEKIKTIFSTEIQEYQSRRSNSQQSLNEGQLTSIVKQALTDKTMAFLETIKQQNQYNGNEFVIDDSWSPDVVLKTNDGQQKITLISRADGSHEDRNGLSITKPPITPIIKSVNCHKYNNCLTKSVPEQCHNKSVCIGDTFNIQYNNEEEYKENKIDDTWMTFNKDDNGQISNIKLSRQWGIFFNDGHRTTKNITEITLQNNKISKIDKYKDVYTEKFEGKGGDLKKKNTRTQIVSIKDNKSIEDTIKDIFSNKNDIAIQNILYELDKEQLNAITNNHEIDISFPYNEQSSSSQDKPSGLDLHKIINDCSECLQNTWPCSLCFGNND